MNDVTIKTLKSLFQITFDAGLLACVFWYNKIVISIQKIKFLEFAEQYIKLVTALIICLTVLIRLILLIKNIKKDGSSKKNI